MNPRKTVTYALVVAASFLILMGISSSRASAQTNGAATLQNQPFTYEVSPACNGDDVQITGKYNVVEHEFTASDGSYHVQLHVSAHGTGIGSPSGQNYVLNFNVNAEENVSNNEIAGEYTVPIHAELIAQGGGGNLYLSLLFHITVNPDGTLTSSIDREELTCQD